MASSDIDTHVNRDKDTDGDGGKDRSEPEPDVKSDNGSLDENDDDLSVEGTDAVDGFLQIFMSKGHYCPRVLEQETWGTDFGNFPAEDDPEDLIFRLLSDTRPSVWRACLVAIFKSCEQMENWHTGLSYLIAIVRNMRKMVTSHPLKLQPQCMPEHICRETLHTFLTGSNLKVTSEIVKSEEKDSKVETKMLVVSASDVTTVVLEGMNYFLSKLLDLTDDHTSALFQMKLEEGRQLYDTLRGLCQGSGIDKEARHALDDLHRRHEPLMAASGYFRSDAGVLVWQKPTDILKFETVFHSIQGLYSSLTNIQTSL